MKYLAGMFMTVFLSVALASAAAVNEENEYGYIDQILATTYFQINEEKTVPLAKFYRVNDSGKHIVCQQYVKLNHVVSDRGYILICEFCG